MQPLNRISLSADGSDYKRIGDNKRKADAKALERLEKLIEPNVALPLTCDVGAIHPPFFHEFSYRDTLGGIGVATLSAEINCRVAEAAAKLEPQDDLTRYIDDKYRLSAVHRSCKKVVFLPGSNFTNVIDQSTLQRLMMDEAWVIKPHPVTNEDTLRDLAHVYGYDRILEPGVSGMELLKRADEVACTETSELFIVARLLGKPVINITRFDVGWLATYHSIIRLFDGTDSDAETAQRVMTSELSGVLRPLYDDKRNAALASDYSDAAMAERETFRMVSNQMLRVADKTLLGWDKRK